MLAVLATTNVDMSINHQQRRATTVNSELTPLLCAVWSPIDACLQYAYSCQLLQWLRSISACRFEVNHYFILPTAQFLRRLSPKQFWESDDSFKCALQPYQLAAFACSCCSLLPWLINNIDWQEATRTRIKTMQKLLAATRRLDLLVIVVWRGVFCAYFSFLILRLLLLFVNVSCCTKMRDRGVDAKSCLFERWTGQSKELLMTASTSLLSTLVRQQYDHVSTTIVAILSALSSDWSVGV